MKKFKTFLCIVLVVAIGVGVVFVLNKVREPSAAEMYSMLNDHMTKIADNKISTLSVENQKLSYELPLKGEELIEDRQTFSGVTEDDKADIVPYDVENHFSKTTGQLDKTYIGYNIVSGEGYLENNSREAVIGWCSDSSSVLEKIGAIEESNILNAEYVVNNNDKLVSYVRPKNAVIGTDTYGEYVGTDYISKINSDFIENNDLVSFFKDKLTLESFNNNVFTLYSTCVADECDYDITLSKNKCTINNNLAKEGNNYVLKCSITSDETFEIVLEDNGDSRDKTLWFSVDCDINVVFDESKVISITYKLTFNEKLCSPSNLLYNSDGKSVMMTTMMFWRDRVVENSFNFSYELDGEKVKAENYSTFDSEITYKKVSINYYGIDYDRENVTLIASDKLECTSDFTARYYVSEDYLSKWYLDEACTIPFSSDKISKVPSEDLNLYAVSKDSSCIIVIFSYINQDTLVETNTKVFPYDGKTHWSFNNVDEWAEHNKPNGATIVSCSPESADMYSGEIHRFVVIYEGTEE